jgi:hypothetical protein
VEAFAKNMAMYPPELASPVALYLAHESCKLNGVMLASGGGWVARMSIMENSGYKADNISMESIAANIDQIIDMSTAANVGIGKTPSMPDVIRK